MHKLYQNVPKFISLFDFIRKLWINANDNKMVESDQIPSQILKFLIQIPKQTYNTTDDARSQFLGMVKKYINSDYKEFAKIYSEIFIDAQSWYNINPLISSYKNIFLNCAKSQDIHTRLFPVQTSSTGAIDTIILRMCDTSFIEILFQAMMCLNLACSISLSSCTTMILSKEKLIKLK